MASLLIVDEIGYLPVVPGEENLEASVRSRGMTALGRAPWRDLIEAGLN
jgi:hypothetical protein